ncbi:unnamed protein product [Linum tenue]|uniref:TF-B3 domain-containing protein n=1 Tax=Linum tenue TaxID=586396 RepID=A0AAV0N0M9_9ROSI|nr:unnamed protein product [Linum tenue]
MEESKQERERRSLKLFSPSDEMEEEGGRRWMFKVKTPRFSTIIVDDSARDEKLCLPKLFTAEYGALLPENVIFKLPSGAEWRVGLLKSGEKIWFQEGWREFADFYSLASGQLLVFQYGSHGHFLVLIFDKTAREIDYQTHETSVRFEPEPIIDISDDTSNDRCPSPKARENPSVRAPQPKKLKRRIDDERTERTSETIICHGSTSRVQDKPSKKRRGEFQKERPLAADERASALTRAIFAFQSKNPFFMIVMQRSYLGPGMRLYLPINSVMTKLEECGEIQLQLSDGRSWMVKYFAVDACNKRKIRTVFDSRSWGRFVKENELRVGDVCVFELVEGGAKPRLKVIIFRAPQDANPYSSVSSPPKLRNGMKSKSAGRKSYGSSGASKTADAFTSKQPFFKIRVADSHLTMNKVKIPAAFREHVKGVYDEGELRVVGGKWWDVRIGRYVLKTGRQEKVLASGWREFTAGNSLALGDVCVFELVKPENGDPIKRVIKLNVHIFRGIRSQVHSD